MRKKTILLTAVLLLCSAVLGWFLPTAVAAVLDQTAENGAQTVKIEPVNLSYTQDLSISDKLYTVFEGAYTYGGYLLSDGIFLKKNEAEGIARQFLSDLLGCPFEETRATASPNMVQNADGNGLVIWSVELGAEQLFSGSVAIDDATGVILTANLFSDALLGFRDDQTEKSAMGTAELFRNAYNRHLQARAAAITCQPAEIQQDSLLPELHYKLLMVTPEGSMKSSEICVNCEMGTITFNSAQPRASLSP